MTTTDLYIQRLLESNPLREPTLREIIQALNLPAGSRGLDAGCGIGLQTLLLIEAIGDDGHVTGLDILSELLAYAQNLVAECGQAEHITFRQGSVDQLPFDDNSFNWVWSADCIGYPAGDVEPVLKELKRVVKPGGDIILLGWSSQQVLPGYPMLEARLNANCSGYLPFLKDKPSTSHFMRIANALQNAGMENIKAQTFVGDIRPSLDDGLRTALTSLFDMLWGTPQPQVAEEDFREYQRLCDPTSIDFILDVPDYYAFFTYSMFRCKVAKS